MAQTNAAFNHGSCRAVEGFATLSEIVNARAAVSAEMALRLELAFGKSAESWLGHQSAFDLWQLQGQREHLGVQRLAA